MPWFKVDDQTTFHPKVLRAGNAAFGAWVRMGAYCGAQLTDGFIPDQVAHMIATKKELDKMIDVELLHVVGGGFQIHDYLDFQPSREQVLSERQATRERVSRHRNGVTPPVTHSERNGVSTPAPSDPIRSRPIPADPEEPIHIAEQPPLVLLPMPAAAPAPAAPSALPGKPSAACKRVVDHWRSAAEDVLSALNAARKRVRPSSRGITPSYDSLGHIADRLEAGKSAADCLHVVEVCESECRADERAFRWFDAVSPFRPDNFERKVAADVVPAGDGAARRPLDRGQVPMARGLDYSTKNGGSTP